MVEKIFQGVYTKNCIDNLCGKYYARWDKMSTGVSSVLNVYDEIKNSQHKATISDSKIWHQRAGMESKPCFLVA